MYWMIFGIDAAAARLPACASPKTYPGPLATGSHTVSVRAKDTNANTSPSTMNYSTNWAWANAFTVGFGVGANAGKISIYVGSIATHVIVDVVAYIQ